MDVRDYEYIVAIADQGNISRAAASLFITQPALTKFLQRTESQLGVSLFVRRGNQFLPTKAGQLYIQTGRDILRMDRKLTEDLSRELAQQKQQIRFGYTMGRTDEIMENVLPKFFAQYPEIQIHTHADTSRNLLKALGSGEIDLAVVTSSDRQPGFQYIPMEPAKFSLAVRKDDPLTELAAPYEGCHYPAISTELLKKRRIVITSGHTNSGRISRRLLAKFGLEGNIGLEVSDVLTGMTAVENGLGVGLFISAPLGSRPLTFLSLQDAEAPEQTVVLAYRNDWEPTISAKYLIRLLTSC